MVLLCLGDHLFRGKPVSPYRELADMAARFRRPQRFRREPHFGRTNSKATAPSPACGAPTIPRLIDVSLIIEKPTVAIAREKLRVDGLPAETWLGWFGMHLLAPRIYDILGEMIRDNVRDNGEFQLTRAQEIQRQREGYLALEMSGAAAL